MRTSLAGVECGDPGRWTGVEVPAFGDPGDRGREQQCLGTSQVGGRQQ